ncbi:MAG: hypothetical protein ACRDBM_01705, partial [Sporomusa sp.]
TYPGDVVRITFSSSIKNLKQVMGVMQYDTKAFSFNENSQIGFLSSDWILEVENNAGELTFNYRNGRDVGSDEASQLFSLDFVCQEQAVVGEYAFDIYFFLYQIGVTAYSEVVQPLRVEVISGNSPTPTPTPTPTQADDLVQESATPTPSYDWNTDYSSSSYYILPAASNSSGSSGSSGSSSSSSRRSDDPMRMSSSEESILPGDTSTDSSAQTWQPIHYVLAIILVVAAVLAYYLYTHRHKKVSMDGDKQD